MTASRRSSSPEIESCRLCGEPLKTKYSLKVLNKYDVAYLECEECHSLQTESPYWLQEAYSLNLSNLDTGAGQRNLNNLAVSYLASRLFRARDVLDYGGGDGLLCRLLRDLRVNCFVQDKYAKPTYSQGFTTPDYTQPEMVLAFEVFEHFTNPATELNGLFSRGPAVLLASTSLYNGQEPNWWYLAPEIGQHIFFYSREAINHIAHKYNYRCSSIGEYLIFAKNPASWHIKILLLKILLSRVGLRLSRSAILALPAHGAWDDHLATKELHLRSRE